MNFNLIRNHALDYAAYQLAMDTFEKEDSKLRFYIYMSMARYAISKYFDKENEENLRIKTLNELMFALNTSCKKYDSTRG